MGGGPEAWRRWQARRYNRRQRAALASTANPEIDYPALVGGFREPFFTIAPVRNASGTVVDFRFTYLNDPAKRVHARGLPEVIGHTLVELVPSALDDGVLDFYASPLLTGQPAHRRSTSIDEDGARRDFDVTALPYGDEVVVMEVDVTSSLAAEREIAASEQRFRLLAENAADVVVLMRGGIVEWVSPAITKVFGWSPEDLIGRALAEHWHPDDRQAMAMSRESVAAGRSTIGVFRFERNDGEFAWVEVSMNAYTDAEGRAGTVEIMRDVTERVAAVQARIESEDRYRFLAENASDVVCQTDAQGRIQWVSESITRTLEWMPDELLGTEMLDVVHPDDQAAFTQVRRRLSPSHGLQSSSAGLVMRVRAKSGSYRWMSLRVARIMSSAGVVTGEANGMSLVDDLVHARQVAEASANELRAVLDSLLDPHVVLEAVRDESGRIIDFVYLEANPAACDYNNMSREELVGRSLLDLMPAHAGSSLFAAYAECVDSGQPLVLDDFAYPNEFRAGRGRYDIRAVPVGERLSYTWRDVTDRFEFSRALAASEEEFRLLADNSSEVVLRLRNGVVIWASPSLTESFHWLPEEWVGHRFQEFVESDATGSGGVRQSGPSADLSYDRWRIRTRSGSGHWVEGRMKPYLNAAGQPDGHVVSLRIIDAQVAMEEMLKNRATFDDLTGALKREPALERLRAITRHARRPGTQTGVLFIDVDHFKSVNDQWGHLAGDTLLRAITERVQATIRVEDLVARLGGDEFLVALGGIHDLEEAATIAEKIRFLCAEPVPIPEGEIASTVSIGVTLADPSESGEELIARADKAMYAAKTSGRNCVVPIPTDGSSARSRRTSDMKHPSRKRREQHPKGDAPKGESAGSDA